MSNTNTDDNAVVAPDADSDTIAAPPSHDKPEERFYSFAIGLAVVALMTVCSIGLCSVMHPLLAIPLGMGLGWILFNLWHGIAGNTTTRDVGWGSILLIVVLMILVPVFLKSRARNQQVDCSHNLKQIGLALLSYAQDYDGYLPPEGGWQERVTPYLGTDKEGKQIGQEVFRCPATARGAQVGYGLSRELPGNRLDTLRNADTVPLAYDSDDGHLPSRPGRHSDGNNTLFADGSVKWRVATEGEH